ncbi:hypothetical protein C2E23DRAFT_769101, partial [Lenzites betulinus]
MATRQNKKRKGRGSALPRERTVTTLTDGAEGSFLPALNNTDYDYDYDDPATLLAPPFAVNTPIAPPSPFVFPPASFPYPFAGMSPLAGSPFQTQLQSTQFFPPQSLSQPMPAQPGQNDLEILERLKQTIKNNQHELFRPVPQPAALASVYLGPKSLLGSHVPPHPDQVPAESSPPGLTLLSKDNTAPSTARLASGGSLLSQSAARLPSQSPHPRDGPKPLPHRSSVSEAPKNNLPQSPEKRPSLRYDDPLPPKPATSASTGNKRYENEDSSLRMGPPGLGRLEPLSTTRPSPDKGAASSLGPSGEPSLKITIANGKEDPRRAPPYARRGSVNERYPRNEADTPGGRVPAESPRLGNTSVPGHGNGNNTNDNRDQRPYDRDRERERDKDFDRDRGRPPPRDFRDRRTDDRARSPRSPETRRYEPRYPPRRYDSKGSDDTSPRLANKSPSRPYRTLGEERAIIRPPLDANAPRPPLPDERQGASAGTATDRSAKAAPPPADDRRGPPPPPSGSDNHTKLVEDRRPPPPAVADRAPRPDDKRPLPVTTSERSGIPEERRRPASPAASDRFARPVDDRRGPPPPVPAPSAERRPSDDRRPPVVDRYVPASVDDRRTSAAIDRSAKPVLEERRPPSLEERISRAPVTSLPASVPPRPVLEERPARLTQPDERAARPVPLEERISRAPSLHERISQPPARQEDRPMPRLEDRIGRPANAPPSLEERLSNPVPPDDRQLRPRSRSRPPRPPPVTTERLAARPADTRNAPSSAPAERPAPHPEERNFTAADRFTRPSTPAGSDRGHAAAARPYRAPSVARDEPPRSFLRPSSPARSPVRSDVREFRPGGEPQARDRLSYRPGPGPEQDRFTSERRPGPPASAAAPTPAPAPVPAAPPVSAPAPAPASAAPEQMDIDTTHLRPAESRLSYRRPSPSPAEYPPRDRSWVPAGEAYREPPPDPSRRLPPSPPHSYPPRDWRDNERPYAPSDDWTEPPRAWDRDRTREYERDRDHDARFVERDVLPHTWET